MGGSRVKYPGSKARHVRHILPYVLQGRTTELYIEPFVGGANIIQHVSGDRRGFDLNPYLICMFQALQSGWEPPDTVTEDLYNAIKHTPTAYNPALVGFVGIGCSFAGKWWGGYARGDGRNYCAESKRNLLNQRTGLVGVEFACNDYRELIIPSKSWIYCDPPYANTTGYITDFNHNEFWQWCDRQVAYGHVVWVSEYNAPKDWHCVWERRITSSLDLNTGGKTATEKLFTKRTI